MNEALERAVMALMVQPPVHVGWVWMSMCAGVLAGATGRGFFAFARDFVRWRKNLVRSACADEARLDAERRRAQQLEFEEVARNIKSRQKHVCDQEALSWTPEVVRPQRAPVELHRTIAQPMRARLPVPPPPLPMQPAHGLTHREKVVDPDDLRTEIWRGREPAREEDVETKVLSFDLNRFVAEGGTLA